MEINCKISSELDNLAKYNEQYYWIPGPENIRPSKKTIKLKKKLCREITAFYKTVADYILIETFNIGSKFNSEGKLEALSQKEEVFQFNKNKFPYQLSDNTNHYIMWYTYQPPDETINRNIYDEIYKILAHKDFQFVWYENPNMNVPGIYHVQVFWIQI